MGKITFAFVAILLATFTSEISGLGTSCKAALARAAQTEFWLPKIKHEELAATNPEPGTYKVYRNVKDFGAKGDGVTDDSDALNNAISEGNRCGAGCGQSTRSPAVVYVPPGKYLISKPIIQYYFTEFVGDAIDLPTLIMAPGFKGIGLIDSDPYGKGGGNWFTNQDNFYRQIRNFIIDMTQAPAKSSLHGIHWQVAQATSLTNLHFRMSKDAATKHQGIWMENGSGGFMSDLTFDGGLNALWVGNQQFTSRNLTITNSQVAIYMNWNWAWTFKGLQISNCKVGLDMTAGGEAKQGVGSVLILDADVKNTATLVKTGTSPTSMPHGSGSLVLDNVHLTNVTAVVAHANGNVVLEGGSKVIESWGQGRVYDQTGTGSFVQAALKAPTKSAAILDTNSKNKNIFERPKPQYTDVALADFVSVKTEGAKGDGKTDDTKAIADALAKYAGCKVVFFPTGTYLVSDTVHVPAGSRIAGEVFSTISATGKAFSDPAAPKPLFQLGKPGDEGVAELSNLVFSNHGPVPGAILLEINIRDPAGQQGVVGLWDVHFRVGGARGTEEENNCGKGGAHEKPECLGAHLMLRVAPTSSAYLENVWAWVADHGLDGGGQVSIYNARGVLIESKEGPVWMYGTASEHSVMYQYNVVNAKNLVMALIQTETPYYQSGPEAPKPYTTDPKFHDPDFSKCAAGAKTCAVAWGLRIVNSSDVYLYGAGLYNFFQEYSQACLKTEHCQDSMVSIENSPKGIHIYNLNTKAADNMISFDAKSIVPQADNHASFCSTIVAFVEK